MRRSSSVDRHRLSGMVRSLSPARVGRNESIDWAPQRVPVKSVERRISETKDHLKKKIVELQTLLDKKSRDARKAAEIGNGLVEQLESSEQKYHELNESCEEALKRCAYLQEECERRESERNRFERMCHTNEEQIRDLLSDLENLRDQVIRGRKKKKENEELQQCVKELKKEIQTMEKDRLEMETQIIRELKEKENKGIKQKKKTELQLEMASRETQQLQEKYDELEQTTHEEIDELHAINAMLRQQVQDLENSNKIMIGRHNSIASIESTEDNITYSDLAKQAPEFKDATREFFLLTALASKLKGGTYTEFDADALYEKALELKLPFYEFHSFISKSIESKKSILLAETLPSSASTSTPLEKVLKAPTPFEFWSQLFRSK